MKIETILTPAELPTLKQRNLSDTVCIVFDILRATSTFVTALENGAKCVIPVSSIAEALEIKKQRPEILLAGERDGVKIRPDQTGGVAFDLGNSPREFMPEKIHGHTIVSTTTNGTHALRVCAGAKMVLVSSFLNLAATIRFLKQTKFENLLTVCAGTGEGAALEDVLAAGALCAQMAGKFSDAALVARGFYESARFDLGAAVCSSTNAQRLLSIPELRGDVSFCLRQDEIDLVAVLGADGAIDALV